MIPQYTLSEFANRPSFRATLTHKQVWGPDADIGKTNFSVGIVVQEESGERLAVSDRAASQELIKLVTSLQEGHTYTFPDVLK